MRRLVDQETGRSGNVVDQLIVYWDTAFIIATNFS